MRQGLFEVYGGGSIGLKAEDLNRHADLLTSVGLAIPEGMVIGSGVFDQLEEILDVPHYVSPSTIANLDCPAFLLALNREILGQMDQGRPYAIRSSALSERGGTGIYASAFFWPTGDEAEDLPRLWRAECIVYASELSEDAELWRDRNNAPSGMAILIQPVVGAALDGHFLPALAGTAFTSYRGMPTIRAAVGLGTTAAAGSGQLFSRTPKTARDLGQQLWEQKAAAALNKQGGVDTLAADTEEIYGRTTEGSPILYELFAKLDALRPHGDLYLEWAIEGERIYVVQAAPYEDRIAKDPDFDGRKHFVLLEGSDVLHSGKASCRRVVYVSDWFGEVAELLAALNKEIKGHLLIVPQLASSLKGGMPDFNRGGLMSRNQQLGFRHFSNAAAVVEEQHRYTEREKDNMRFLNIKFAEHTGDRGASHFAQLCGRSEILFIGAEFNVRTLLDMPGMKDYRGSEYIAVWDLEATALVDAPNKRGTVYIAKETTSGGWERLLPSQIMDWSFKLRDAANRLSDAGQEKLAAPLYDVHYALPEGKGDDLSAFDPFAVDDEAVKMCGGLEKVKASLAVVLAEGGNEVEPAVWSNGLQAYLEELRARLG